MRRISLSVLSVVVLLACGFSEDPPVPSGSIRGEVVTLLQNGEPAVSPHARLVLHGPINKEAESDAHGAFAIDGLPPGTYNIEANAPGLNAAVVVEVTPGSVSLVPITLSVAAVTSSVTVTATEPPPIEESAQKNTIGQKTVEAAPNQNEKIESLLPLVPGVVRGPDGRINMKGAQSTQAGGLVNSANVSDPATGGNAINLPIDVVSSVQVISNPYDPEYGKFTGAISSVETRTGNMEKFHFSVQNLLPRARVRDDHVLGIGAVTPRATVTGPLIKDRLAFTQSLEYRFVRTPVELLKKNLRSEEKQIVAANMNLSDSDAEKFWPVYDRFASDLSKIYDRKMTLVDEYLQNFQAMTGDQAESYIRKRAATEEDVMQLRLKYVPDFRKVLSGRQAALFFQIEWRLDLMINLQLAQAPMIDP